MSVETMLSLFANAMDLEYRDCQELNDITAMFKIEGGELNDFNYEAQDLTINDCKPTLPMVIDQIFNWLGRLFGEWTYVDAIREAYYGDWTSYYIGVDQDGLHEWLNTDDNMTDFIEKATDSWRYRKILDWYLDYWIDDKPKKAIQWRLRNEGIDLND